MNHNFQYPGPTSEAIVPGKTGIPKAKPQHTNRPTVDVNRHVFGSKSMAPTILLLSCVRCVSFGREIITRRGGEGRWIGNQIHLAPCSRLSIYTRPVTLCSCGTCRLRTYMPTYLILLASQALMSSQQVSDGRLRFGRGILRPQSYGELKTISQAIDMALFKYA